MANTKKPISLDDQILGKALREWDDSWRRIPGGFEPKHPKLSSHVGLARAILKGKTMYILRGTEDRDRGIEKSLQRIRGKDQTGNRSYGAQMIRENIDVLDLEVLLVGEGYKASEAAKELKKALVKIHDPEWNRPARRRMQKIRDGKGN